MRQGSSFGRTCRALSNLEDDPLVRFLFSSWAPFRTLTRGCKRVGEPGPRTVVFEYLAEIGAVAVFHSTSAKGPRAAPSSPVCELVGRTPYCREKPRPAWVSRLPQFPLGRGPCWLTHWVVPSIKTYETS